MYMTRVVESIAEDFGDALRWEKVVIKTREGARRFRELHEAFGRFAPVPSLVIDGRLVFESTPDPEELKEYLSRILADAANAGQVP